MAKDGRRKVTPEMKERMVKLRKEGLSYAKIADKLGLSLLTVYNYLKKEKPVEKEKVVEEEKKPEAPEGEKKGGFIASLKRALGIKQ